MAAGRGMLDARKTGARMTTGGYLGVHQDGGVREILYLTPMCHTLLTQLCLLCLDNVIL